MPRIENPFHLRAAGLQRLLDPDAPLIPELEAVRGNPAGLLSLPRTQLVLSYTAPLMPEVAQIPITPRSAYRRFRQDGDRPSYEAPYYLKRRQLVAAVLRMFLGQADLKDVVQDHLWAICEETNWVVPAHEDRLIDLMSAETAFGLAETLLLLGDALEPEVRWRVRQEIERRIFDPYIRLHHTFSWYKGGNNWNGVCNGAVAATFLLLEPEPARACQAVELALQSLDVFLDTAFEKDGSSTEGVSYWNYGLSRLIDLAEMLRARSHGALDLLSDERMKRIAAYPAKLHFSGPHFASFSDCGEQCTFHPGQITRLAERTGERSLLTLLAPPGRFMSGDARIGAQLRDILWWPGETPAAGIPDDAVLPAGGLVRLAARSSDGVPVYLAAKAGHNDENHNHNDIGSFILHVDGENLLVDPGHGLYSRAYFGPERYENIFANSYGHSVPRIAGQMQATGRRFEGKLLAVETRPPLKTIAIEMAGAYPVPGLTQARRTLQLATAGAQAGTAWLQDEFAAGGSPLAIEEAFVTWGEVQPQGATALIRGEHHALRLTVEEPAGATFTVERLEEQCRANAVTGVLKRLAVALPATATRRFRMRMEKESQR